MMNKQVFVCDTSVSINVSIPNVSLWFRHRSHTKLPLQEQVHDGEVIQGHEE